MTSKAALRKSGLVLAILGLPALAWGDEAMDWLAKIQMSTAKNNYEGTFVYRQGDQMEAMRIAHRVGSDGIRERLFSLNGWAREIIRNRDEVICYLPDKKAAMAGHAVPRSAEDKFPKMLPETVSRLSGSYRIKSAKAERIAGRPTVMVSISPRDEYRYGYHLWADQKTGLLLKSDLLDEHGKVIEQFMFTDVSIGIPIKDKDLQPTYQAKGMAWQRAASNVPKATDASRWEIGDLPKGYRVTGEMMRSVPGKPQPVAHLMVSDGLAAVSVFVEPSSKRQDKEDGMVTGMGSAHAYRAWLDGHKITAVGEVPAATVERIGRSIRQSR